MKLTEIEETQINHGKMAQVNNEVLQEIMIQ